MMKTARFLPLTSLLRWNIAEKADCFHIKAYIPGIDPKDIEVSMENGYLTVKGERESETKEEKEDYSRIERSSGSFYRSFSLPESADPNNVTATWDNGVLNIKVGKTEIAQSRIINIKFK